MAVRFALRSWGWERFLNPKVGSPAYSIGERTQITYGCENQQGFCLPGKDGWRYRKPLKEPMHKISFAATYPGLQQREGRVD